MEQISVKAVVREARGKEKVKKMRGEGFIPAIVYHRGEEPIAISLNDKEITKIIHDAAGENLLINLAIEGGKKKARLAIIKEIQYEPVKRSILHVDFNEISMTEKLTVEVEVVAKGTPIGVKQDGGVMDHPLRALKITCLPMDIPKHIDVDVSGLGIGDSIHVSDVKLSDKIQVLTEASLLLFHVKLPVEVKVEDPLAPAPEIEVIREKKEDEAKAGEKKEEPKKDAKAEKK